MELLAPAGNKESLIAALESGADAVYFGLQSLNARRGAVNFNDDELHDIVELIHSKDAKAFLALNIDFTTREISTVAKSLLQAQESGVDAVIFTDPAILPLIEKFPDIDFHFSTQASITSELGMQAAKELGVKRVVLAREMSKDEITAAAAVEGIETEVFVQGAMCLCVSGKCLLSSFGGGRSGNRGSCTSPCRVKWRVTTLSNEVVDFDYALSLRDLSLVEKIPELQSAGVDSLKIEGRLKNAAWVSQAVRLYRSAIDGVIHKQADALPLGDYAGRMMSSDYFDGSLKVIQGAGARAAFSEDPDINESRENSSYPRLETNLGYSLMITEGEKGFDCELRFEDYSHTWTMKKSVVRNEKRAITIAQLGAWLEQFKIQNAELYEFSSDCGELYVPKKFANNVADEISASLHRAKKNTNKKLVKKASLPEEIKEVIKIEPRLNSNKYGLRSSPNRARIDIKQANRFLADLCPESVVIENMWADDVEQILSQYEGELIAALPSVFFKKDIPELVKLAAKCKEFGVGLEVNGWDGFQLAKDSGAEIEGGAGMMVLNQIAAKALYNLGFKSVYYSLEAGGKQMEDISSRTVAPMALQVYGRPVLVYTRAELPAKFSEGTLFEDSRGIKARLYKRNDMNIFRAEKPTNLSGITNPEIRARWIVADLIGAKDPVREWKALPRKKQSGEMFNYERGVY